MLLVLQLSEAAEVCGTEAIFTGDDLGTTLTDFRKVSEKITNFKETLTTEQGNLERALSEKKIVVEQYQKEFDSLNPVATRDITKAEVETILKEAFEALYESITSTWVKKCDQNAEARQYCGLNSKDDFATHICACDTVDEEKFELACGDTYDFEEDDLLFGQGFGDLIEPLSELIKNKVQTFMNKVAETDEIGNFPDDMGTICKEYGHMTAGNGIFCEAECNGLSNVFEYYKKPGQARNLNERTEDKVTKDLGEAITLYDAAKEALATCNAKLPQYREFAEQFEKARNEKEALVKEISDVESALRKAEKQATRTQKKVDDTVILTNQAIEAYNLAVDDENYAIEYRDEWKRAVDHWKEEVAKTTKLHGEWTTKMKRVKSAVDTVNDFKTHLSKALLGVHDFMASTLRAPLQKVGFGGDATEREEALNARSQLLVNTEGVSKIREIGQKCEKVAGKNYDARLEQYEGFTGGIVFKTSEIGPDTDTAPSHITDLCHITKDVKGGVAEAWSKAYAQLAGENDASLTKVIKLTRSVDKFAREPRLASDSAGDFVEGISESVSTLQMPGYQETKELKAERVKMVAYLRDYKVDGDISKLVLALHAVQEEATAMVQKLKAQLIIQQEELEQSVQVLEAAEVILADAIQTRITAKAKKEKLEKQLQKLQKILKGLKDQVAGGKKAMDKLNKQSDEVLKTMEIAFSHIKTSFVQLATMTETILTQGHPLD